MRTLTTGRIRSSIPTARLFRHGIVASTDFAWSTYMRECVIAGEIAERAVGKKLARDATARRFDNAAANAFLTRPYRKGWEIPGLA